MKINGLKFSSFKILNMISIFLYFFSKVLKIIMYANEIDFQKQRKEKKLFNKTLTIFFSQKF